jgi:hypothetical protein
MASRCVGRGVRWIEQWPTGRRPVATNIYETYARTGTLAVRSSLPQLTHAPLIARRIAFQMQ